MTTGRKIAVTGAILCGGKSSRLGTDKAHAELAGKPLLSRVIERLEPQVEDLVLSIGQDHPGLTSFQYRKIPDVVPSHRGPLIGLCSALRSLAEGTNEWLALCPCDAPFLPSDLVERLLDAAKVTQKPVAVARYEGVVQPTFSLWHRDQAEVVASVALGQGQGGLMTMLDRLDHVIEDWKVCEPSPFFNINTLAELEQASGLLDAGAAGN